MNSHYDQMKYSSPLNRNNISELCLQSKCVRLAHFINKFTSSSNPTFTSGVIMKAVIKIYFIKKGKAEAQKFIRCRESKSCKKYFHFIFA
jgi:hypothetical protein